MPSIDELFCFKVAETVNLVSPPPGTSFGCFKILCARNQDKLLSGKFAAVYACAKEEGFQVIESELGCTFHRPEASELISVLGNCLLTYRDYKRSWVGIQRRGMMQDLSWGNAAQKLFETSSTSEESNSDEVDTSSDDSRSSDLDDESFIYSQHEIGSSSLLEEEQVVDIDTHGVEWDIFHQIDVPKIL
ncbi:hypothetical protein L2E82_29120 [Cichorium intybus]|uniref:Uncharacterized protein n=1 Tax=Cichorium intybus TaxID=13427 RepID=A0ACB9CX63_CICIN|nr:hypothetical protein L2E82_29120 [Cichorium intybus]